jgi:ribosomal protein S1
VAKIGDEVIVRIIDIDFDKRRMAFSIKQVENPVEDSEDESAEAAKDVKPEEAHKEQENKEIQDEKRPEDIEGAETGPPEEKAEEPAEGAPGKNSDGKEEPVADEKEKQIKEILKELKDEANLD